MAGKSKGKGKGGGKKGLPRWLLFVLGGVAVAGVMGAFDRLLGYDRDNGWVKGMFLAGAAVAGAFLLKKGNLISQSTANTIGAAGLAIGGYVALGPKVYEIGNNVADSFAGMFKKGDGSTTAKRQAMPDPTSNMGGGNSGGGGVNITGGVPTNNATPGPSPSLVNNAIPTGGPSQAGPTQQQQQAAPQSVTYVQEAPKISGSNYLFGKGIDAVASLGGALLGNKGLFGSGNERRRWAA